MAIVASVGGRGRRGAVSLILAGLAIAGFLVSLYFLVAPERPLQKDLVIGTDHSPPFQVVRPDGSITGAVVEALNLAAARAGIRLHWVHLEMRPDDALRDLDSGIDLWPMVTVTPERGTRFYTTQPIGRAEYQIAAIDDGVIQLRSYQPRRVAMTAGVWLSEQLARDFPEAVPVIVKSGQQLTALCDGRADAMVADAASIYNMAIRMPPECLGKRLVNRLLADWYWDLAIGSTAARSAEADRIRAEFGHLARTGALHDVFADYPVQAQYRSHDTFAETRSERERRHARITLVGLCICCLAMLAILARTHRRAAEVIRQVTLKSEFLDRMSHELRTPLNGVLGLASLLSATPLSAQQKDYLRLIRQCGEDLLKLVTDSLALSRLASRAEVRRTVDFAPKNLVEDTLALLAPLAHAKDLDLIWVVSGEVPRLVHADADSFRQLLVNLVGNAVKYSPQGQVRVALRASGLETGFPFLRCEVDDSGPGVPAEDRARVFDTFVRLNREADRNVVGTGLGLAIAKELVVILNGRIGIDESDLGGARFWFEFPVQAAAAPENRMGDQTGGCILPLSEAPPGNAVAAATGIASVEGGSRQRYPRLVHVISQRHEIADDDEATGEDASSVGLRRLANAAGAPTSPTPGDVPSPSDVEPRDGSVRENPAVPESLEMLAEHLQQHASAMHWSEGIGEGIRAAVSIGAVDLVVLEGQLPGACLHRAVAELRQRHGQPRLPVIVLCSASAADNTCTGLRPVLVRVLRHPFLTGRFEQALDELRAELDALSGVPPHLAAGKERGVPCEQHDCPSRKRQRAGLIEQVADTFSQAAAEPCPHCSSASLAVLNGVVDHPMTAAVGSLAQQGGKPPRPRALVADDNSVNRLILVSMLRPLGIDADIVGDGREVLAACERRAYQLLILDHHMPMLDGLEAAESLRAAGGWKSKVPMIICTAADTRLNAERYRTTGIGALLTKPFTLQQLREALSEAGFRAGDPQGSPEMAEGPGVARMPAAALVDAPVSGQPMDIPG